MNKTALVTGADRGLGRGLTQALLERGWTVIAGRNIDWPELTELQLNHPAKLHIVPLDVSNTESVNQAAETTQSLTEKIDLLISNAGINRSAHINSIREDLNFEDMLEEHNVNAIGALRVVKAFLPLFDQSDLKRLCFVSSEAGSIEASTRTGWFGYCMSKSALNIAVKILENDLKNQGYTFRLYHPGWLRTYLRGTKNMEAAMEPEEAANLALRHFLEPLNPEELKLTDFEGVTLPW